MRSGHPTRLVSGAVLLLLAGCGGNRGSGGGGDGGLIDGGGAIDSGAGADASPGCGLITCSSAGASCGPIGDGCDGTIQCGDCTGDETCGGGGTPSVCGNNVPCTGLCGQQVDCTGGATTSLSGTVYTPAGDLPLYNVSVYVPNAPLDEIVTGNDACLSCDAPLSGTPLVVTTTDAAGNFVLEDVPVGTDIPLVIQTGKWRRVVTIDNVAECVDTPVAAELTRFPRVQGEFGVAENNIPRIALTTGGADALECLLLKIGIDLSEFTPQAGAGRVNLYAGEGGTDAYEAGVNGGADFSAATALWNQLGTLDDYDMVVLSCEGSGDDPGNRGPNALQSMSDYLSERGGRVFGSHWHHAWAELGPAPMPTVATFNHRADLPTDHVVDVNTTFAKGQALATWLVNVGASLVSGELVLIDGQHTVDAVNESVATAWITGTNPNEGDAAGVQYLSFNTPIGDPEDQQCGRMVVTDIHVAAGDSSDVDFEFPGGGCDSTGLLPEEKALIFLLFDLASCVTTDFPGCTPRTCADVGAQCGPVADGCGALLDCGDCTPPATCGGGGTGTPNVCSGGVE